MSSNVDQIEPHGATKMDMARGHGPITIILKPNVAQIIWTSKHFH